MKNLVTISSYSLLTLLFLFLFMASGCTTYQREEGQGVEQGSMHEPSGVSCDGDMQGSISCDVW